MSTSANMPNPGTPLVGLDGRLAHEWFVFFVSLLARTGGQGTPIDIGALQTQVNAQAAEIGELFVLGNGTAAGALLGALMARVAILEMALQGAVPIAAPAAAALPEPVAIAAHAATQLPEPVPVAQRVPDDLRKLIEA
ncbi:TPA: hypothetical protein SAO52_003665 [Burkholderia vietnamiensis]|nr:hypothetical protein [Burkholderia vietnamiensis]